jgi:protein gp37
MDWVIVGGESGIKRREMDVSWLTGVVDQCRAASVPVFVKQDSGRLPGKQGRIPAEYWVQGYPEQIVGGRAR